MPCTLMHSPATQPQRGIGVLLIVEHIYSWRGAHYLFSFLTNHYLNVQTIDYGGKVWVCKSHIL